MDTEVERPRWRLNAAYRATPRLSLGIELNPVVGEVLPNANWIALLETDTAPMVNFGLSSDRIFTPEGHMAYYVTFAKGLKGTPFSPYISLSYSEFSKKILTPVGLNVNLRPDLDGLAMYDGRRWHLLLTKKFESSNVTLMMVRVDRPVFGISVGWGLR